MSKFLHYSPMTKKFIMAIAGLFLITFLPVHLGINLFILPITEGHEETFREAVHFMISNPLVKIGELFLFAAFIIHVIQGVILQLQNWLARPKRYKIEGWAHTSFFSKFMIHTGAVIFVFLLIHFINFYFVKLGWTNAPQGTVPVENNHDFYHMATNLFSNSAYSIVYIVMILALAFHLKHAFQSAFQTFGLNHSKYTPAIKFIGHLYSIFVPLGFITIPLYFLLF